MTLFNLPALRARLGPERRLLGIDPGRRTIGLALSDVSLLLASPYGSLRRGKLRENAAEIAAIAVREGAGGLVVGLPLSLSGEFGPAAQSARDWTEALAEASGLPAAMWDERWSSAVVNRMLIGEADASRARRSALVDKLAAVYMLQGALDASRIGCEVERGVAGKPP